jgi:hypothetical protein
MIGSSNSSSSSSGFWRATTSLGCPSEAEYLMYGIGMIKHEERTTTGCNQTDERHFVSRVLVNLALS